MESMTQDDMTQDEAKKYFYYDDKAKCPEFLSDFSINDAIGRKKFIEGIHQRHPDFKVHPAREKDTYDCCGVSAGTITMIVEVKDRKDLTVDSYNDWVLEGTKYDNLKQLGDTPTSPKWPKTVKKFFVTTCTDGMLIWNLDAFYDRRESKPHRKKFVDKDSEEVKTEWCYYNKNKARIVRFCEPTQK